MSNATPSFGTLGTLSSSLLDEIGKSAHIESGTSASALLADGSSALDLTTIKQALGEDKSVTVASPSEAVAKELGTIVGGTPFGAALVTLSKGPKGYKVAVVPKGTLALSSTTEKGSNGAPVKATLGIGANLAAVPAEAPSQHATRLMQGQPGGLTPPTGSYAGYSSFSSNPIWNINPPQINGQNDDKTDTSGIQTVSDNFLTEFFVYWVNGTGNNGSGTPYYIVILKQTGTMSAGNVQASGGHSLGWFQESFQITPNNVCDWNTNKPFDPSVATVKSQGYSPSSGAGPVQVSLAVPMTLWANVQGGMGPSQFTATVNDQLALSQWAVLDQTSGINTAWEFYQNSVWNPISNPFSNFGSWYQSVYSGDDVVSMTNAATGSIQFEAVSAWRFDSPSFQNLGDAPAPASLGVAFSGAWNQTLSFLHSPAGCQGIDGTHHHLFSVGGGWGWGWGIDLGAVARQQNIS